MAKNNKPGSAERQTKDGFGRVPPFVGSGYSLQSFFSYLKKGFPLLSLTQPAICSASWCYILHFETVEGFKFYHRFLKLNILNQIPKKCIVFV